MFIRTNYAIVLSILSLYYSSSSLWIIVGTTIINIVAAQHASTSYAVHITAGDEDQAQR
jgi:hypothetical protein